MPQVIHHAGIRSRKGLRSARSSAIFLIILLIAFAGGFVWNVAILPRTTATRDAYRAAAECAEEDDESGSSPAPSSVGLCRYTDVQVTSKWRAIGRYSTSYHVSLRSAEGSAYPNVILNRAEFWKTTQVNQSLVAQIMNARVTMLRGSHATVMTTDHPYSRLYLARMRILIFGGMALLMFVLFRKTLRQVRSRA